MATDNANLILLNMDRTADRNARRAAARAARREREQKMLDLGQYVCGRLGYWSSARTKAPVPYLGQRLARGYQRAYADGEIARVKAATR